ncbi:MAG TPA: transcription elongation factor GreA [Firmicutes bacterium]|nr:transcription elongation factor GreA [Bacillota bacterium]
MVEKEVILSPEGLKKLEEELEYLKSVKRREVAERIKQAREFGDINENSEYDDAKNEQAFIEGRILTLENLIRNAKVVSSEDSNDSVVTVGSTVVVRDSSSGEVFEYSIVGSAEADPAKNKISNESPVGKALLGQRVGKRVSINIPLGQVEYEILKIHR